MTFTVTATTGAGSLTYQWQQNGANIDPPPAGVSGATTNTLTIANVQESSEGLYRCVVSNAAGSPTSTAAQLTVCEWLYNAYQLQTSMFTLELTMQCRNSVVPAAMQTVLYRN